MTKIIISYKNNHWNIEKNRDTVKKDSRIFLFFDIDPVVYKNLRFGYEYFAGESLKNYEMFPPTGTTYGRTDQDYVTYTILKENIVTNSVLRIWFKSVTVSDHTEINISEFVNNG